jgi:peptidoglycan/LPS O-acetylase OafA/YrhL
MTPPPDHDTRYHSLDLWRGLIALWVVVEHVSLFLQVVPEGGSLAEGWIRSYLLAPLRLCLGAPLFFVISGYCVAANADAVRRRGKSAASFITRRLKRIMPPYWAALGVFVVLVAGLDAVGLGGWHSRWGIALASPQELGLSQWLGNFTLTETWRSHLWGQNSAVYTGIAWSLCYQEQFYAVCVLALVLAPRRLYGALMTITAVLAVIRVGAWDAGMLPRIDGTFLYRWHEFAVGLAVYWRLNVARTPSTRRYVDLGLFALLALAIVTELTSTIATAACGLVLIALRSWDLQIANLPCLEPLRACGKRSYSLYLIHVPVCLLVGASFRTLGMHSFWGLALCAAPAMIAASIAASWVFYHMVERHFVHERPALPPAPQAARAETVPGMLRPALAVA